MRAFMTVAKALADENRVRVVLALPRRELCVCQIVELLELAPSTVSKHMAILKQAGLVESRKEGRWIYYRLAGDDAPAEVRSAIAWVRDALGRKQETRADRQRLQEILACDPEELCRKHTDR